MMNRKLILFLTFLLFSFFSCRSYIDVVPDSPGQNNIQLGTGNGDIYLVKTNHSSETLAASRTGYISDTKSRSINIKSSLSENLYQTEDAQFINDTTSIDIENQKLMNELISYDRAGKSIYSYNLIDNNYSVGDKKNFYLLIESQTNSYKNCELTCKYTSKYCNVWYSDSSDTKSGKVSYSISDSSIKTLGENFDSICELEEKYLGSHIYTQSIFSNFINPQKKIDIILYDVYFDSYNGQTSGTFGFFYSRDMFNNKDYSNKSQCIFIDSYFFSKYKESCYSTLVHEYNHLLNCVNKLIINGKYYDSYYTEMLSLLTEDMFNIKLSLGDNIHPKHRIKYFVQYYNLGFVNWNEKPDLSLAYYANVYVFGAYMTRNFGGINLIKEIATNPYTNSESINNALIACNQTYIDDNGNKKYVDFDYLLDNEFQIVFNRSGQNENLYTLNKSCESGNSDNISLKNISITDTYNINNKSYKTNDLLFLPCDYEHLIDLHSYAFSIHYVGNQKNISECTLNYMTNLSCLKHDFYIINN